MRSQLNDYIDRELIRYLIKIGVLPLIIRRNKFFSSRDIKYNKIHYNVSTNYIMDLNDYESSLYINILSFLNKEPPSLYFIIYTINGYIHPKYSDYIEKVVDYDYGKPPPNNHFSFKSKKLKEEFIQLFKQSYPELSTNNTLNILESINA